MDKTNKLNKENSQNDPIELTSEEIETVASGSEFFVPINEETNIYEKHFYKDPDSQVNKKIFTDTFTNK